MAARMSKFERPTLAELNKVLEINPGKALAVQSDGSIQVGSYTLTPTGLQVGGGATFVEWQQLGDVLRKLDGALQWLIGDWLVQGERVWKQTYEEIADATGYDVKTLYNYSYVATHVDFSLRKEKLSFGHHNLVTGMSPDEQRQWLDYAAENSLSISQMRAAIAGNRPTPSSLVERYQTKLQAMEREFRSAGQGERMQLGILLRQMADRVERGE